MSAALKAAFATLLIIVLVIAAVFVLKYLYDNQGTPRLKRSQRKVRRAHTTPAPAKYQAPEATSSPMPSGTEGAERMRTRADFLQIGFIAVLATLFVKLWSMQILSHGRYEEQSNQNRYTTYSVRAPRGRILDRNGEVLADNRSQLTVVAAAEVADDRNIVHRLSNVLGIPRPTIRQRIQDNSEGSAAMRVVAADVSMRAASFIAEHDTLFPGVSIESRTQRIYPNGTVAAHVLGYASTISESQLKESTKSDGTPYESGDIVGQSGAEQSFESVLQGIRGSRTVQVDASGTVSAVVSEEPGEPGNDVVLTIDLEAQKIADEKLLDGIKTAHDLGHPNCNAGAVVAIDVRDGGVVAMSSYPNFNPNEFVNGISSEQWDFFNKEESVYPLTNRAVSGLYPAASTFKGYVSMAGLKEGYIDGTKTSFVCNGVWTALGERWAKKCWDTGGHGPQNVIEALVNSCDIFFYNVSLLFYQDSVNGKTSANLLQEDIMQFGLGSITGIDLAGEAEGRIPTAEWKAEYNTTSPDSSGWMPGDMANLSIGQGDVLITPLQNAVGFAGIATGTSYKPHILKEVLNANGETVLAHQPEVFCQPDFPKKAYKTVREGLKQQAAASDQFTGTPYEAAGKSGTAEVVGKDDLGWYVGYAPADKPQYVVACCTEQSGGGGTIANAIVRQVLSSLLDANDDSEVNIVENNSR